MQATDGPAGKSHNKTIKLLLFDYTVSFDSVTPASSSTQLLCHSIDSSSSEILCKCAEYNIIPVVVSALCPQSFSANPGKRRPQGNHLPFIIFWDGVRLGTRTCEQNPSACIICSWCPARAIRHVAAVLLFTHEK